MYQLNSIGSGSAAGFYEITSKLCFFLLNTESFRDCYYFLGQLFENQSAPHLDIVYNSGADPGFLVGSEAPKLIRGRGADLQHGQFSVKMYVKMKEVGPIGGGGRGNFCM